MKRIKTTITYKVPSWEYCNHEKMFKPSKDTCRFCVPTGKNYTCALYNMPLSTVDNLLIEKTHQCVRATAGFGGPVEDVVPEPHISIDPSLIMKVAINGYTKVYKDLVNQGYPAALAEEAAKQYMLEG